MSESLHTSCARRKPFQAMRIALLICAAIAAALSTSSAEARIVRIFTSLGNIDVRLYDALAPQNVENFMAYVNANRYDGTFFHRHEPGFVIQGGGYTYNASNHSAPHIPQFPMVQNEFGLSNLRGTIAMAKLPPPPEGPANGGPNSATSEWFINLSDSNASNLDYQNGGFTVFGRVINSGMSVVDQIAQLQLANLGGTFGKVPVREGDAWADRFVYVTDVQVRNFRAGDYNQNFNVNETDYNLWRANFGSTTNAAPDGNENGKVDIADYVLWRMSMPAGSGASAGVVPEPSSAIMAASAAFFFAAGSRRRRAVRRPVVS